MNRIKSLFAGALVATLSACATQGPPTTDAGWVPLFDGTSLHKFNL